MATKVAFCGVTKYPGVATPTGTAQATTVAASGEANIIAVEDGVVLLAPDANGWFRVIYPGGEAATATNSLPMIAGQQSFAAISKGQTVSLLIG